MKEFSKHLLKEDYRNFELLDESIPLLAPRSDSERNEDHYEKMGENVQLYTGLAYGHQLFHKGYSEGLYSCITHTVLRHFINQGHYRILDAGCGVGRTVSDLASLLPHATIYGLDYSYNMVRRAKELLLDNKEIQVETSLGRATLKGKRYPNVEIYQGDVCNLKFEDESFDCVISNNLIDRVPYIDQAINEMARVLKKGGFFILTSPLNFNSYEKSQQFTTLKIQELVEATGIQITEQFDGLPYQEVKDTRGNVVFWHNFMLVGKKLPHECVKISRENIHLLRKPYEEVFASPPWNEYWNDEQVAMVFRKNAQQTGFFGEILRCGQEIAGFYFGYALPDYDIEDLNFSSLSKDLKSAGRQNTFYLSEFGIVPKYWGMGYGCLLARRLQLEKPDVLFRTINPAMVRLMEKAYNSLIAVNHNYRDSQYADRKWYLARSPFSYYQ